MADELRSENDKSEAELSGMPLRSESEGRDRIEEIASEYIERLRTGERLTVDEFISQHPPQLAKSLREILPVVAAMETWKTQREIQSAQMPIPESFEITHLGEFRIIREIARGGMGVVFEADQPTLNRRVAVKLLPWKFPKKSSWSEQFLREARIAARLQHAHIVPVYSFGKHDGRYYYTMQLIQGVGLDKLIYRWNSDRGIVSMEDLIGEFHPTVKKQLNDLRASKRYLRKDNWQQLGKIAAQIVSAIRYAHRHGTLHRDIKPGNLLIDLQGKVWITDFGLALPQEKLLAETPEPMAGTLRYMAPEQFENRLDERSDLYAFGATLYELCTLQPVFNTPQKSQLIKDIQQGKFPSPRSINKQIPIPLERIILKCLERDRDRRYLTADQLHADLLRFLNRFQDRPRSQWWRKLFGG